jgi:beta-lactamase class A
MALAFTVDAPRPFEANPGLISFRSKQTIDAVSVRVNGRQYRLVTLPRPTKRGIVGPFGLPSRDETVTVIGLSHGTPVGRVNVPNVLGLPRAAGITRPTTYTPSNAQLRMRRLAKPAGASAAWTVNLASGRGASWNAGARFTAASTAKLPIMMLYLIALKRDPVGAPAWGALQSMIRASSNDAANTMLRVVGGGNVDTGGARVTALIHRLGAIHSDEAGGYLANQDRRGLNPPVVVNDQPQIKCCKVVTAHDLGLLMEEIVQAANGTGRAHAAGLSGRDARVALWLLSHTAHPGLFEPWTHWVVAHKVGYIDVVWHDVAAIFEPTGTLISVALTENDGGASEFAASRFAHGVLQIAQTGLDGPERTAPRRAVRSAG